MGQLLIAAIALILYASLFPWNFTRSDYRINPLWIVFHAWQTPPGARGITDILLNIGIYVPVGIFGALGLRKHNRAVQVVAPLLLGSALSLTVEVLQVYDVSRYPSGLDWVTNTAGSFLGAGLAVAIPWFFLRPMEWVELRCRRSPAAAVLLALWLVWSLFPIIPYVSLYRLRGMFIVFLTAPWPFLALASALVGYAAVGMLLQQVSRLHALPALAAALLLIPFQMVLIGRQPALVDFAGAVCGFGLFAVLRKRSNAAQLLAAAMCLLLILRGLHPFRFSMSPTAFSWIPLVASFESDHAPALFILIEKCWWYGAAVWLLGKAGVPVWKAAGLFALLMGCIEAVQMWLPGRTPEITDPLLAIAMALLLRISDATRTVRAVRPVNS